MLYFIIFGLLGADAGGSCWWSKMWHKRGEKGGVMPFDMTWFPEFLLAISVAAVSTYFVAPIAHGFIKEFPHEIFYALWLSLSFLISFLGIQTGHAAILPHDDVDKLPKGRDNTLTPLIIAICKLFRLKYEANNDASYSETYVWVFWMVKGLIVTLPIGGLGVLGMPFGYEIGSHFKNRPKYWRYNPHFVSEFAAYGLSIGVSIALFM